jgi:hypothetical protein
MTATVTATVTTAAATVKPEQSLSSVAVRAALLTFSTGIERSLAILDELLIELINNFSKKNGEGQWNFGENENTAP